MGIRNKTKEELLCQSKSFLDYLENSSKITKEQSEQIFKILSNDNNISTKELVKESLKGVLDSQNFESLYGEYIDYIGGIRNYIKKFQLFEGYEFLDDEFVNLLVRTGKLVKKSEFKPKKIHDIKDEIRKNKDVIRRNIELLENNGFKGKELIISVLGINLGKNLENIKIIQKYYKSGKIENFDNYIDIVYLFFCGNFSDDSMKKLELFLDAGIKSSQDFIKKPSENSENLSDIIERSYYSTNNVELLCGLGINKVEDFLKLDWLLTSQKTDLLNFIIKLLNKNIVAENVEKYREKEEKYHGYVRNFLLDDEIKDMILNPKSEEAIRLFFYIEGEGNGGEGLEKNKGKKIKTKDLIGDLKLLRPFIQNYNLWKMKNIIIQLLLDKVTQDAKTLCSLKEIIEEGNIEILRLLIELEVTDAKKLQQLQSVIIKGNEENLKVIINDVGIKGFENILKLQDIVCAGENQKLKVVVEKLKEIRKSLGENKKDLGNNEESQCSDFLKNLGNTIIDENNNIRIERLKLMIDAGVYTDENIEKCKDLGKSDLRILEIIVSNMGIKFVDENGELDKNIENLKEVEKKCKFKVLRLFKKVKVKNIGQLIKLSEIFKTDKTDLQLEYAEKNIKEFKDIGITDIDDILKLKDYIFCNNAALNQGFNLLKLTNLFEKKMIIKLLPEYRNIFDFLNNFLCNLRKITHDIGKHFDEKLFQLCDYVNKKKEIYDDISKVKFQTNLLLLNKKYPNDVENLILRDSGDCLLDYFLNEGFDILVADFNDLLLAETENLKTILDKYPEIKIEELYLLKDILSCAKTENLKNVFDKYPEIKIEELNLLKDILSRAKTENLKVILYKCPKIKKDELFRLRKILSRAEIGLLKIILDKYPEIKIEELIGLENEDTHILSLAKLKFLNKIFEKYPEIRVEELVLLDDVFQNDEVFFEEFLNFGTIDLSEKSLNVLDLFSDHTKKYDEIFKNMGNKEKIGDDNWIDITGLYSVIEYFEDDKSISEDIKVKIRELLSNDESKDFVYEKLFQLLKKSLSDNVQLSSEEIALLAVLNKKGLLNMGQSESLAKFIYQINKLDKNYKFNKAFTEIKGGIDKFINSHKKDSNELINSFYQVSTSLLERSPAIYRNVVELLTKLNSKEQELFYKEIFPLYNVELFLGENSGQYKLYGKKINNNESGQLMHMHQRIKMLLNKLEIDKYVDINSLLLEEKDRLVENIKQLFKEKFGIKKFSTEFTNENIESIKCHSIYLSNMNDVDEEKTAVLGYFLALKLDGKRTEFRTGKFFDPSEYMEDSKVSILREYLAKKSERNSVYKLENIEEDDKTVLQENESNTIIGNTNGIIDRLNTIVSNIETLLDDDIYSERQKIIKKYINKNLGKLLAKQFQKLSGKNIVIDDKENEILTNLSNEIGDDLSDIKNVQELQNECKPISSVINFINKVLNENLQKEIQDFENLSKPSNEHLELLRKIGINLENGSIVSSNSYLTYLKSGIRKGKNKLTQEEYDSLSEYILRVDKELGDLYGIKDKLTTLYGDFKDKIMDKYFDNTVLKERFETMSPYFFTKADVEKENIVSLMTNDLDIVIKNIRQCLGCKNKGCNNDTDLSFGCDDRFFITTSHKEGDASFADELVTLLPRESKEDGFTFVMDRIYGNNGSTDILLNNIYVILKKINKLSSTLKDKLSIFVPDGIGLTLNGEGIDKLRKKYAGIKIEKQGIAVVVESQPVTDSYHEFGGLTECRGTGVANLSGYLITLKS